MNEKLKVIGMSKRLRRDRNGAKLTIPTKYQKILRPNMLVNAKITILEDE